MLEKLKEVAETSMKRLADSPLGKKLEKTNLDFEKAEKTINRPLADYVSDAKKADSNDVREISQKSGGYNDVKAETSVKRLADSPLGKRLENTNLDFEKAEKTINRPLADYVSDAPNELCDDNGRQYRTEKGSLVPNNAYVLDKTVYRTDDNGTVYSIGEKMQSNTKYELNGNVYKTDDKGRIISCEAKPVRSPENPRDNEAQRLAGGEDRRQNDQGGHIVGRDMNGDVGIGNLVAMDSKINQSDYKRMENDIKTAYDDGKYVTFKADIAYSGDSQRPDKFTVDVKTDGTDTVYKFDNNLDGSLRNEVPENGKEMVQDRLNETGGEISSVKEEYDENGKFGETTVYITYKNEDGINYRTSVVIENR